MKWVWRLAPSAMNARTLLAVAAAELDPDAHDVPMDLVVTPERVVETNTPHDRPAGVDWSRVSEEDLEEMPVLARLRGDT